MKNTTFSDYHPVEEFGGDTLTTSKNFTTNSLCKYLTSSGISSKLSK
jgi:hypothetical protein